MSSPKPTLDDLRIERSREPESTSRFWPVAIGIVALGLAVVVLWWLKRPGPIAVHTVLAREATGNGIERTVLNASGYVTARRQARSEEHTSELQSLRHLVCRLLLEKKSCASTVPSTVVL